jgi:hypothetical protein
MILYVAVSFLAFFFGLLLASLLAASARASRAEQAPLAPVDGVPGGWSVPGQAVAEPSPGDGLGRTDRFFV